MTKEQQEACEKLAKSANKVWYDFQHKRIGTSYYCGFTDGFQAAQTPEMLMLNPLVKGLVEALEGCIHPRYYTVESNIAEKALAPFGKSND